MAAQITLAEASQHNTKKSLYLIIHDKVYDVTKFVDEHPGGEEVLLDEAGKDATEAFEDIGHSDEAREILKKYYVGDFKADPNTIKKETKKSTKTNPKPSPSEPQGNALRIVIPIVILGGWLAYRYLAASN